MKPIYAKILLKAYPLLQKLADDLIDERNKTAINSYKDPSPAMEQCLKIMGITEKAEMICTLKAKITAALSSLTKDELTLVDVRYFKKKTATKDKTTFATDTKCRNYFRMQTRILMKLCAKFNALGLTSEVFEEDYLPMINLIHTLCDEEMLRQKALKKPTFSRQKVRLPKED